MFSAALVGAVAEEAVEDPVEMGFGNARTAVEHSHHGIGPGALELHLHLTQVVREALCIRENVVDDPGQTITDALHR